MAKDLYSILGVPKSADDKDIRSAYRKLARKFHPDVNPGDKAAEARFKEISAAHEVLGDPEKRKLYDKYGDDWERVKDVPGAEDMEGYNFGGGGGFESIFQQFFTDGGPMGGRGSRVTFNYGEGYEVAQPRDLEKTIELTLEEIDKGTTRVLTYQTMDAQRSRADVATVPSTRREQITIPAGFADGARLKVAGKGHAGVNGRAGDLYVTVKWAKHDRFTPAKNGLEVEVPVSYTVAALGGEIKVPTLRSNLTMKIPAGTMSGQTFRLGGQGISNGSGGRTDLMAKIKITVPKVLSSEERALLEQLLRLEENK